MGLALRVMAEDGSNEEGERDGEGLGHGLCRRRGMVKICLVVEGVVPVVG